MNLRISIDTLRIDLVNDEDNTIATHKATLPINATGETQKVLSDIHAYIREEVRKSMQRRIVLGKEAQRVLDALNAG